MLIFRNDNPLHFRLGFSQTRQDTTQRLSTSIAPPNEGTTTVRVFWHRKTRPAGERWVSEQKMLLE